VSALGPRFAGRAAFVTGGRSGIGRAVVQRLLADGARVASFDLLDAPREEDPRHFEQVGDVRDEVRIEAAVADAAERFGGLDALVCCAGVTRDRMLWKLDRAAWDEVLGVNLTGAWLALKAVVPHLRSRGGGAVVNVASINGLRGKVGQANYAASKAGLVGLTKTAARELGAFGVRVNAVAPGFVRTPMTAHLPPQAAEQAVRESALGCLCEPDDVSAAVCFLLSDDARRITGEVLRVDAGQWI
jgi:acetoacetyl-CoA reductase/3-oxoacyl-[acyl-carrier protein] reductase